MQEGLGGLAEGDITWIGWYDNTHSVADKWEAAMAKAGAKGTAYDSVTDGYMRFWSSSEGSYRFAVDLCVKATGTGTDYSFSWFYEKKGYLDSYFRVRPVLAF